MNINLSAERPAFPNEVGDRGRGSAVIWTRRSRESFKSGMKLADGHGRLSSSSCVKREALAGLPSFGEQS